MTFKMFLLMALLFLAFGFGSANAQTGDTPVPVEPVTDIGGNIGQYSTQCVVNGFPAIVYYDVGYGKLKYARATDATGTAWGTLTIVPTNKICTADYGKYAAFTASTAILLLSPNRVQVDSATPDGRGFEN